MWSWSCRKGWRKDPAFPLPKWCEVGQAEKIEGKTQQLGVWPWEREEEKSDLINRNFHEAPMWNHWTWGKVTAASRDAREEPRSQPTECFIIPGPPRVTFLAQDTAIFPSRSAPASALDLWQLPTLFLNIFIAFLYPLFIKNFSSPVHPGGGGWGKDNPQPCVVKVMAINSVALSLLFGVNWLAAFGLKGR